VAEMKDIVESKFEEAKKKVIAKHDELIREMEVALRNCEERTSGKFKKIQ